ncbi:MAG: T9SS type A sorting domain-containing protein, partial [Bacteroidales bacterium]|nr:T9SS type A sorting domain-containing protein [Bacteroidales bacterium]
IVSNIQTNIAEKSLLIYPNPASSIVNIHSETHSKDFIQIFDASGRMQYSGYVNESIDVSAWSEGLYIIKLVGNSGVITKRLIVSH